MREVWNPFSPSSYANGIVSWADGKMKKIGDALVGHLQQLIIHPPQLVGDWVNWLYGNALGLIPLLAFACSFVATVIAMVFVRKIKNFFQTVAIAIVVSIVNVGWFGVTHVIYGWGTSLAQAMQFYHSGDLTKGQKLIQNPISTNAIITMWGLTWLSFWQFILLMVVVAYTMLNITVNVWMLPALTFYGISDGAKKFVKLLVSVMLVTMLFGRAVMVFAINLGEEFTTVPGFSSVGMHYVVLIVAVMSAVAVQPVLIWLAYKGVNHVIGWVTGRSWVRGTVDTKAKDRQDVNLKDVNRQHGRSMRPIPVEVVKHEMTVPEATVGQGKQDLIKMGGNALAGLALVTPGFEAAAPVIKGASDHMAKKSGKKSYAKSKERKWRKKGEG